MNPRELPKGSLEGLLLAIADDELVLGHRDSEWTGYAPILEEDIAFSNIAQDEIGHSLVWFSLYEQLSGKSPDAMAFERVWKDFTCCRFVSYPKSDFAYTVVRQYLFDAAELVRLKSLTQSSYAPIKDAAGKIIKEEAYHILHSQGLVERLGDATDESHMRMQKAVDDAFPQALGMFEELRDESALVTAGVVASNPSLQEQWLNEVLAVLASTTLKTPVKGTNGSRTVLCKPDFGGRNEKHNQHLEQLVRDMQTVYQSAPGARW